MKPCTSRSALFALIVVAPACGRDHSALADRGEPRGGAAGTGGIGGSGGSGGRARGGAAGSGAAAGGTAGKYVEPPGRSVTTFFHGVVDAERALFCFARHDQADPVLVGDPFPAGGIAYAQALVLESIDEIDLESEPVLPYVIAGDLELVGGMTCEQAVERARQEMVAVTSSLGEGGAGGAQGGAGGGESGTGGAGEPEPPEPPALRVATLPVIPAGALSAGYSSLYVAVGCMGGPAFTHARENEACGSAYAPDEPTLSAVLVTLSRTRAVGKLTFQAVHASLASPTLNVSSVPPDIAVQPSVPIVYDLRRGAIVPQRPAATLTVEDYAIASPGWQAQAWANGARLSGELWRDILERAGLDAFEPGRGYTLVVAGPRGDVGALGFWNLPAIGVVDNDPEP